MKKIINYLVTFVFLSLHYPSVLATQQPPISIDKVLELAEKNSPYLSAALYYELAAKKSIDVAKSRYYPFVNLEAIDSKGFPGSSELTYVSGLMGSPYRSGPAIGVVAQQMIYDFGRTAYDVEASRYEAEYAKENTRVTAYNVKELALKTYYECTLFKTLHDTWKHLGHESEIITKEINHFVETGQYSIVDGYLSKAQTEAAHTAAAFFAERVKDTTRELAVIMAIQDNGFSCPSLPKHLSRSLNPNNGIEKSPFLMRAKLGSKVAQSRLEQKKATLNPLIMAVGSAGHMEKTRLVKEENYAVGIGFIIPLFDMHATSEIKQAKAIALAKDQEIAAEIQHLETLNAKYDEIINSSNVRMQHLAGELELAHKAFHVAKDRYFNFEGDVIDLREAFRNLSRVETEIVETQASFLQASGSKALLNSG